MTLRFSLSREVFLLAAPVIGQSFLQTLVVFVDRVMLGRYSAEALASMQINGALLWSITSTLSAFSVGSVALVGRGVGGRDRALAATVTRASLLLAVGIGLLISLVGFLSLDGILGLFPTADIGVKAAARAYLSIVLWAMPMKLISIAAAANLQAAGNTRTPFLVALMSNTVNLAVNYCLIFGNLGAPTLGIRGVTRTRIWPLLEEEVGQIFAYKPSFSLASLIAFQHFWKKKLANRRRGKFCPLSC
jgi:Na+-driven multidrug efflux pump